MLTGACTHCNSGTHAREIEKNTCFQLLCVEAVLYQIADTYDALQLIVLDNWQVTDPRYRHSRKHGIHAIGRATAEDRRRHQLLDIKAEYCGAVSGHRVSCTVSGSALRAAVSDWQHPEEPFAGAGPHFSLTVYHPTSTCRIGDFVDPRLRVKGVGRLRVADASVMPAVIGGNTNAPSIMIGEKAAEM